MTYASETESSNKTKDNCNIITIFFVMVLGMELDLNRTIVGNGQNKI